MSQEIAAPSFASLTKEPIRVKIVDVGTNLLAGTPPYLDMLRAGTADVVAFEPSRTAFATLNARKGAHEIYLPLAVGDGARHTLHFCAAPGMTSLLEPNPSVLNLFHGFPSWAQIVDTEEVDTVRLDDVVATAEVDLLKIDAQGAELMVLRHAEERLKSALVVQTKVGFLPLYVGQPAVADLDRFLRERNFVLHRFFRVINRTIQPLMVNNDIYAGLNQWLEADAIYVRDFTRLELLSDRQLLTLAAIMQDCYHSYDVALHLLLEHDRRTGKSLAPAYLAELKSAAAAQLSAAKQELSVAPRAAAASAADPLAKTARSAWVPAASSGGTELMISGLLERVGPDLDRINLRVNDPGTDSADPRPRVVWLHHDTNQPSVQWCKNKALVATVSCFVFVSYWQRDKYLAAFGLPPERCVVLRNATEVAPDFRPWEAAPVWRCAYTSTPFRGLSVLLDAWQRLKPANAELHIWSSMKLYVGDDGPFNHLYERAQSLPGVAYHGIAPNPELRAALRRMHFLAYPSTFAETSCLAVIEAMAAGLRVIVPSFGALPETTCGYARVYAPNADAAAHASVFADVLASELARPWSGAPELALAQQRHCAAVYDWSRRASEWRQLINSLCDQSKRAAAMRTHAA